MRKFAFILVIGCFFAICLFSSVFAIPDPRDSVIIESKTIAPGVGSPAAVVGVFITNKDTLACITLALVERSITGGAYMTLAWPRTFKGVTGALNTPLQNGHNRGLNGFHYNSVTPDTFILWMIYEPTDIPGSSEPPNLMRRRILEIKFDSVKSNLGALELDSAFVKHPSGPVLSTSFVGPLLDPLDIEVNFVKGIITVAEPARGDMDGNGAFTLLDVTLLTNCVFVEGGYQPRADATCDGVASPADVVAILRKVFLEYALPQCPS
jgi:hypothetical protein